MVLFLISRVLLPIQDGINAWLTEKSCLVCSEENVLKNTTKIFQQHIKLKKALTKMLSRGVNNS